MRAVVVYESIFGTTRTLAEAVGEGLRGRFSVVMAEVSTAPAVLIGIQLLVIGGPIHAWSMIREITPSPGIGVHEYIDGLPTAQGEVAAAAFDTALRAEHRRPASSAAKPAARRLEAHGYRLLVKPEHFYVVSVDGPLEPGELDRAHAWGVGLADAYLRADL